MCGFIIYNFLLSDETFTKANELLRLRGPDNMNIYNYKEFTFVHHILSITGEKTLQPFVEENNKVICLYNGEIYNYKNFNTYYKSDGECIIPLYLKYGDDYASYLDGEFSIVIMDFNKNILLLSSDIFGTKPIFYAFEEDGRMGIASYESCLVDIGLKNIKKMSCNFTKVFYINKIITLSYQKILYQFDIRQYKENYEDFVKALTKSIEKRCKNTNKKIFVSLSSGYDSGLICAILNMLNIKYSTVILDNDRENIEIIKKRIELNNNGNNHIIRWDEYNSVNKYESFIKSIINNNYDPTSPSFAASYIYNTAKNNNYIIHISGHGVDEIMSDYYGSSICNFNGTFPEDLNIIFPKNSEDYNCIWKNFYNDVMYLNIRRDEFIGGCFGIESRYPFLDKEVVQEFLWLDNKLKNNFYKAPLKYFLELLNYPFDLNIKIGLSS